jgi:3-dehydroquinate synthetase
LNLGHTLGHAFESSLKISHGLAVGMGLKYLFKLTNNEEAMNEWKTMVHALALPLEKMEISHYSRFDPNEFFNYLGHDKKKLNSKIRLVLVKKIGSCYVEEIDLKELRGKIQELEGFTA